MRGCEGRFCEERVMDVRGLVGRGCIELCCVMRVGGSGH